jgi:hypothetical protein
MDLYNNISPYVWNVVDEHYMTVLQRQSLFLLSTISATGGSGTPKQPQGLDASENEATPTQ